MARTRPRPAPPAATTPPVTVAHPADPVAEARKRVEQTGVAVAMAQIALTTLAADAPEDERMAAIQALAEAEDETRDAEAAVQELAGLSAEPINATAPAAVPSAGNPEANASEGKVEISAQTEGPSDRDASRLAGGRTPATLSVAQAAMDAEIDLQIAEVRASLPAALEAGGREAVLAQLSAQRVEAQLMMRASQRSDAALAALEVEVRRSVTGYPLTPITYDNALREIGEPVRLEPELLDQLAAAGTMSRTPPKEPGPEGDGPNV